MTLNEEKETLRVEHTEELTVLSVSLKEHYANESRETVDVSNQEKQHVKEIQKLHDTIEDKNYHINKLQQKLLKQQLEMEEELENHEREVEELKAEIENSRRTANGDDNERVEELKMRYEKEMEELRSQIRASEESETESNVEEKKNKYQKEIEELQFQLKRLEESSGFEKVMEEKMEEEQTKFRREIMAVKDRLNHQHQTELDGVLSQLEQLNTENEELKETLQKELQFREQLEQNDRNKDGSGVLLGSENGGTHLNGSVNNTGGKGAESTDVNQNSFQIRVAGQQTQYYDDLEAVKSALEKQYQQQIDHITARLREEYQHEQDDNIGRIEEEFEQQFQKQRAELEGKLSSLSRQLKLQHQADLDRATADMEEQIQQLKNGHAEETADLSERIRCLSEERRRSVLRQDSTEQSVIVIKEEYRTKVDSLEHELRIEKEKNTEYREHLENVEAQVQAFKTEKEQEVKLIEEELRRKCKSIIEKKGKELKERYQSELNEKVNKVEKHWRKQYDEDMGKTRCELEESNRTLKEKYEKEVSDIMIQMEEVQQKHQEVMQQEKRQFEEHQKEMFQKQLSEVKEELEPYKNKCIALEKENKDLMNKYEQDLCELKSKLDEVEERYHANELEGESVKVLKQELELYKKKLLQLESGNKSLVENYEAQIANMKRNLEEIEEGDLKVLNEEVKIYQNKIVKLQEAKQSLKENCDSVKLQLEEVDKESKTKHERSENARNESEALVTDLRRKLGLSQEKMKIMETKLAELALGHETNKQENIPIVGENEEIRKKFFGLEKKFASYKEEHEEKSRTLVNLVKELETARDKCSRVESENQELENRLLDLQQRLESYQDERVQLQEEATSLIKEIEVIKEENCRILSEKTNLESNVAELKIQFEESGKDHNELKKQLHDAINEMETNKVLRGSLVEEKEELLQETSVLKRTLEDKEADYEAVVSEKDDLEKKVAAFKEQIAIMEHEKEKVLNETELLQQRFQTLSEQLGNRKVGNNETMREIEDLNVSLNNLTRSLENSKCEQERIKSEKEDLSETLVVLRKDLETNKEETKDLNVKNEQLEKQLSDALNDLKSNKSKLTQLQEKKKKSDNKLGAQIQRLMMSVRNLESDVGNHQKRCKQLEDEKKHVIDSHEMEINELMTKIETMETSEAKLEKVQEEKSEIEKDMIELKRDLTTYQRKISGLQEMNKTVSNEEEERKQSLQDKIKQLEENLEGREKELKQSRDKLKELQIEKEASDYANKEEITALKIVLKAFEGSAEDELYRVSKEKYSCEMENAGLRRELNLTRNSLNEQKDRNNEYKEEIATLVNDVERLKTLAENSQGRLNESFAEEKQTLCKEIEILKRDLDAHKSHVTELEEEGGHSFGVLLSQHEKELEALKEELEDQIAKKREQLAKDAAAKRQKLREEYESKVRVLYDELVAEKSRMKDQYKLNEQLTSEVTQLEGKRKADAREIELLEENVKALEERLKKNDELELQSQKKQESYEKEDFRNKIETLEAELKTEKEENARLLENIKKLQETQEKCQTIDSLQEKIENLQTQLEKTRNEYDENIKLLEKEKEKIEKELQKEFDLKQILQREVKERDAARQAVVQDYDLRMEELALELDAANGRTLEVQEKLEEVERTVSTREGEWKAELDQLTRERENLITEHQNKVGTIEKFLEAERIEVANLKLKVQHLESQLSEKLEKELGNEEHEKKRIFEEFHQRAKQLEEQLVIERNEVKKLRLIVDSNEEELIKDKANLKELRELVEQKENVIEEIENKIKQTEEKLLDEERKSTKLAKELESLLKTQSADYINSLERVKEDLKQEYDESNIQLKKNYESIFARMEEEQKVKREEMETEIETLKGMVDNLEQLNQLKDEEHEVLMKEQTDNFENEISELQKNFDKEKGDFVMEVKVYGRKLIEITTEKGILIAEHEDKLALMESKTREHQTEIEKLAKDKDSLSTKAEIIEKQLVELTEEKERITVDHEKKILELKTELSFKYQNKIEELSRQVKSSEDEKQALKNDYEKEIGSLQKQLSFENSCQLNLQTEHDRELSEQKESLEIQHKREVERYNNELQAKARKLDSVRSEYQEEVRVLSVKLEELNSELETLKEGLASKHEAEITRLEGELEEKSREFERRETEHKNEVQLLSQKIHELSTGQSSTEEITELKKMRNGYDLLVSSLREQNQELGDMNDELKKELEKTLTTHQENFEVVKVDLERQYKHQQDKLSKKHAEELDSLLQKLEALVQQENISKSLTEEHMKGIENLREEFDRKLERLTREKRRELESAQRVLEQQYKVAITGLNEQLVAKEAENTRSQEQVRELQAQVLSLQKGNHNNLVNCEDAMRLRQENTELYRKLREEISGSRASPESDKSKRQVEQLKAEIEHLKMVNKNLRSAISQNTVSGENEAESLGADRSRLLQLIKLMEQLMKEKNDLELKLREEIIDLKTRFGMLGDNGKNSHDVTLSSFSPEKPLTRDALVEMLQELRENKQKQEEDIRAHVAEIESMIEDVKSRLESTEFTDKRIQEVLESQFKHLEEQRRLMVYRLWQLREKHKSLEEKITQQIAGYSNWSSPGSDARTRCYENMFEESLRREKELLSLKRKQVEDLQERLALEKTALEKHVADKRKFQRELREKDKLETALSSERNELERKWIGKLKAKELELKHEKAYLESKRERLNSILGDVDYRSRTKESAQIRLSALQKKQKTESILTQDWKRSASKTRYGKETKDFTYETAAHSAIAKPSIVDYGTLRQRTFAESKNTSWKSPVNSRLTHNRDFKRDAPLKSSTPSSNTRFSRKVEDDLKKVHIPSLSLATDGSDPELDVSEELLLDLDSDDSDPELYKPHSVARLDDHDPNWERNLEQELKRISAGGISTNSDRRPAQYSPSSGAVRMNLKRSQSDLTPRTETVVNQQASSNTRNVQADTSSSRPHSFDLTVGFDQYPPRTSTAAGHHSPDKTSFMANGFANVSQIPTVLPNLFRDLQFKGNSSNVEALSTKESHSGDHNTHNSVFGRRATDGSNFEMGSPRSARTAPMKDVTKETPRYKGQDGMRTSPSLFMINFEEYVDRHQVQFSDDVACLREPSPSEKRLSS